MTRDGFGRDVTGPQPEQAACGSAPTTAPDNRVEQELLRTSRAVAVVGLSTRALKDSQIVARHLQRNGYRIVPVHPKADSVLGEKAYPSLGALPPELAKEIDLVNVFRPAGEVPGIVEEALTHLPNLKGVWAQKGIQYRDDTGKTTERGVTVVADRCIRTQHLYGRFIGGSESQ